ncbi:MFS transporter [Pseudonocardia sp. NPDC046786]|uniref:MFS transporter n=1 Tax=Pseudonocardia sp. NPDC046786 TaxID=3155471 RepID=UPI0033DCFD94
MRNRLVLAVCLATGFTTLLDQAALTVAVPALRSDLGADTAQVQWILAAYSLTFGLALVPAGRLGDAHGRHRLLVGGLALFSSASLLGACASDPWMLVAARLLQGLGAGTANPQVLGLIQDRFEGTGRTRALGAYATVAALSSVLAPLVGGGLLAIAGPETGWRLVVAVNVPFGLATCLVAALRLGRGHPVRDGRADLDLVGVALLTLLTLCVLLPVVGAGPPLAWSAAGVAVLVTLVRWERRVARRGGTPVLLPALLRSRGFVLGTLVAMCWFGSSLGSTVVITLALQDGLGLSPLAAGLCTVPAAIGMGLVSWLGWRVVTRWGRPSVTVALASLLLVELGTLGAVLTLPDAALPWTLAGSQLLVGAAGGLVTAPNQGLSLALAPAGARGLAAGFFQVSQRISATLCLAAGTGLFVVAGAAGSWRTGLATGIGLAAALIAVALVASAADRRPVSG